MTVPNERPSSPVGPPIDSHRQPIRRQAGLLALLGLLFGLLLGSPAYAAPGAEAKVRNHLSRAQKAFRDKRYDQAIQEFLSAYKLIPAADILFNVGKLYELKGDSRRAVEHYARYLQEAPEAERAAQARERAEALTPSLLSDPQRARFEEALEQLGPEGRSTSKELGTLYVLVGAGDDEQINATLDTLPKRPPPKPAPTMTLQQPIAAGPDLRAPRRESTLPSYARRWWFWTAVAGGAVVLGVAIGVGVAVGTRSDPTPTIGILQAGVQQ